MYICLCIHIHTHAYVYIGAISIPTAPLLVDGTLANIEDPKFLTADIAEQGGIRALMGTLFVKLAANVELPAGTVVTLGGLICSCVRVCCGVVWCGVCMYVCIYVRVGVLFLKLVVS
jgi:hypothetical protein